MKRLRLLFATITVIAALAVPVLASSPAYAVDVISPICQDLKTSEKPTVCSEGEKGLTENPISGENGVLRVAIKIMSIVAGVSAIIIIIVAGLKIILSNGDSNSLATARKQIIYAAVGLVVVIASNSLVTFILNRIG